MLTGTLQKMIVENGSVTMNVDLNGLNGSNDLTTRSVALQFSAGTNSFFPILFFNERLRSLEPGSIALVPEGRRLFSDLSVAENLVVGGYSHSRADERRHLARVFERPRCPA